MNPALVCDTNLLVSAAIFPNSVPARAYDKAVSHYSLVASIETLSELHEVINRPKFDKYIQLTSRLRFFETYRNRVLIIDVTHSVKDCRDSKDDKFLNLALSASTKYIVTGDSDLLVLNPYHDICILSPIEFLK